MREHYDKEAAEVKRAQGKSSTGNTVINSEGKVEAPQHLKTAKKSPTYTAKASKKWCLPIFITKTPHDW